MVLTTGIALCIVPAMNTPHTPTAQDQKDYFGRSYEEQEAYTIGCEHARNAASWITDGNDTDESRRAKLQSIEDYGANSIINYPNLSGKFAGDPTPYSLYEDVVSGRGEGIEATPELLDSLADAYEQGVSDTLEDACVAELRRWLKS